MINRFKKGELWKVKNPYGYMEKDDRFIVLELYTNCYFLGIKVVNLTDMKFQNILKNIVENDSFRSMFFEFVC